VDTDGEFIAYLKPGVRLEDFTQILVDPFAVSYASPRGAPDSVVTTLDLETEQRLTDVLREAFIRRDGRTSVTP
jgi:hypothetical protein